MKVQHKIHMRKRMLKYFIIIIEFYRRAEATSSQKWIAGLPELTDALVNASFNWAMSFQT